MTFKEMAAILKANGVYHITFEVEQNFNHRRPHTCYANMQSNSVLIDEVNITVPDILDITRVLVKRIELTNNYVYTPTWVDSYVESYDELLTVVVNAEYAYTKELLEQQLQIDVQLAYLN